MKKIVGKVSDFEIVFGNGIFNCCYDDIESRSDQDAFVGMKIICDHCGAEMILKKCSDNKLRWQANV